nr:hypothetical protein [Tanacetum cinerariifolium]
MKLGKSGYCSCMANCKFDDNFTEPRSCNGRTRLEQSRKNQDLVDYVYAKYENNGKESDEIFDEMLADLYNYDMLKGKYLSVVESSKATDKDYTKLLVTDEMLEYVCHTSKRGLVENTCPEA